MDLPQGFTDWWDNLVRSGFAWKNLIGQDADMPVLAKAWCEFDGTVTGTNAPTVGYGVTSVTRNATGDYTITFAKPFTTAKYAASIWASVSNEVTIPAGSTTAPTASACRFTLIRASTEAKVDMSFVSATFFGNQ